MFKKTMVLMFTAFIMIPLVGCGIQNVFFAKKVPPLGGYSKVLIVPFDIKKPTGKYEDLPIIVSYGIGTKLSIYYKDKSWLYDQSRDVSPVSAKMKELNISAKDAYLNPQAAVKLAQAVQADLVIVGQMQEPAFTKEASGKIEEDKTDVSSTGTARYYSIYQTAMLRTDLKVVETNSAKLLWEGRVLGYKKYKTSYRTGQSEKSQREETMAADVRKDFIDNFVNKLFPVQAAEK